MSDDLDRIERIYGSVAEYNRSQEEECCDNELYVDYEPNLREIKGYIENTIDDLIDELDACPSFDVDLSKYNVEIKINGRTIYLDACANTYNGLVEMFNFMIENE